MCILPQTRQSTSLHWLFNALTFQLAPLCCQVHWVVSWTRHAQGLGYYPSGLLCLSSHPVYWHPQAWQAASRNECTTQQTHAGLSVVKGPRNQRTTTCTCALEEGGWWVTRHGWASFPGGEEDRSNHCSTNHTAGGNAAFPAMRYQPHLVFKAEGEWLEVETH